MRRARDPQEPQHPEGGWELVRRAWERGEAPVCPYCEYPLPERVPADD